MRYCLREQSEAHSGRKWSSVVIWIDGCSGPPRRDASVLWHILQIEDDLMEPLAGRTGLGGLTLPEQSEAKGRVSGWTRARERERWAGPAQRISRPSRTAGALPCIGHDKGSAPRACQMAPNRDFVYSSTGSSNPDLDVLLLGTDSSCRRVCSGCYRFLLSRRWEVASNKPNQSWPPPAAWRGLADQSRLSRSGCIIH